MGRGTCSPVQEMIWSCVYWLFEFLFNLAFLCSWVSRGWGCVVLGNFFLNLQIMYISSNHFSNSLARDNFCSVSHPTVLVPTFSLCLCAGLLFTLQPDSPTFVSSSSQLSSSRWKKPQTWNIWSPSWPAVKYFLSHTSVKNVLWSRILINVVLYQRRIIVPWTAAISQKTFSKLSVIVLDSFVGGKTGDV